MNEDVFPAEFSVPKEAPLITRACDGDLLIQKRLRKQ